jgi:hypothetical protein
MARCHLTCRISFEVRATMAPINAARRVDKSDPGRASVVASQNGGVRSGALFF